MGLWIIYPVYFAAFWPYNSKSFTIAFDILKACYLFKSISNFPQWFANSVNETVN